MKKTLLTLVSLGMLFTSLAQTYSFTNAGAIGQYGPTQVDVNTAYSATNLSGMVTVNTQGIQEWIVPVTGTYQITAIGACGGELQGTYYPGLPGTGATIQGEFSLTAGTTLNIVVGQKGVYGDNGSGGGGGSFVFTGLPGGAGLLLAAGGGGGHGHGDALYPTGALGGGGSADQNQVDGMNDAGNGGNQGIGLGGNSGIGCAFSGAGAGGAGWGSNGMDATCGTALGGNYMTFVGGYGGVDGLLGGFGGGGGADGDGSPGGGGGGYTGGGGGNTYNNDVWGAGAGGGSYNSGLNPVNTAGVTGAASGFMHGSVTIVYTCSPSSITPDVANLPDEIGDCSVTGTAPTATNNCGAMLTGTPDVTFPIITPGTTVVTWTYDDGTNVSTQTQNFIVNTPDNGVTLTVATLTSNETDVAATYQWLDCNNAYAAIVGETNQAYTPAITGNYAVAVALNGCSDTSACMLVDYTGLGELSTMDFTIYPNPGAGVFNINYPNSGEFTVEVFDISGKMVHRELHLSKANTTMNLSNLEKGSYQVRINNGDHILTKNLVVL